MISRTHLARLAGLLYLVVIAAGAWSELAVRSGLVVRGDVPATAANIADSSSLLRQAFVADLVMIVCFLLAGLALHALLVDVSRGAATAMLVFNAVAVALMSVNMLNHAAAIVVGGDRYSGELGSASADALAAFFLEMHGIGYFVAQVFFGLYLLPLGYLVLRSGWLPTPLGVLLMIGGLADMAELGLEYALSDSAEVLIQVVAAPAGIAELALALWLVVRGIGFRSRPAAAPAPA